MNTDYRITEESNLAVAHEELVWKQLHERLKGATFKCEIIQLFDLHWSNYKHSLTLEAVQKRIHNFPAE